MVERKEGGICKGIKKQGKASPGFVCYCFLNPVLKQNQHMCLVEKILLKSKNKKQEKGKSYLPNSRIKGEYHQQCYRNKKYCRGHYEDTTLINQITEVDRKIQDHKKKQPKQINREMQLRNRILASHAIPTVNSEDRYCSQLLQFFGKFYFLFEASLGVAKFLC